MRKNPTKHEEVLWFYLKSKKFGVKFRRQHGIGGYIVDFYCKEKNLIIELDGSQHLNTQEYDQTRDAYLKSLGLTVLRFWNEEIDKDIKIVTEKIKGFLNK